MVVSCEQILVCLKVDANHRNLVVSDDLGLMTPCEHLSPIWH
jgi:hypothetical protein